MAVEREQAESRSDHFRPSVDDVRPDAVLDQLRRAGITTLEEFAEQYAAAVSASIAANARAADLFRPPLGLAIEGSPEKPGRTAPPPIHRPPRLPLSIDGETAEADEIQRFKDTPVHLVIDKESEARGVVSGFTDPADRDEYLSAQADVQPQSQSFAATASGIANETGYCYENTGFGGAVLRIPRMSDWWNYTIDDMTRSYRSCFLFWCWNPWNDVISSVRAEYYPIRFYEHIYLQGSSLTVAPWSQWPDLGLLGWNDRISSLRILV
jgi:hypothetical protein